MNTNRAQMRLLLVDLQERQKIIRVKARNACSLIIPLINPALADIEDMDIVAAATAMDELVMHQAELLTMRSKISELEEALYG